MLHSPDLYLGTFLVLSGFALSLLNLKRIVKSTEANISAVLLSENLVLVSIGIAFVSRAVYEVGSVNVDMRDVEERSAEVLDMMRENHACNFKAVLMSYGPLILSLVNSFISLIIDNYMHYRMIQDVKMKDEENTVEEIGQSRVVTRSKMQVKNFLWFWKKYFSYIAIVAQWLFPILMVLSMYPMGIKEKVIPMTGLRSVDNSCMAMLEMSNETCQMESADTNFSLELRKSVAPLNNYFVVYENEHKHVNVTPQIDSVIKSVFNIVTKLKNQTSPTHSDSRIVDIKRESKSTLKCLKMCFVENKKLAIYMLFLAVVSYFVPITISTVILTKIHLTEVKRPNIKTYVSRELLYNILFWTPVMFDTLLSLLLCAYTMNGMRTSLLNVIANIYQAVKNFMNTKYFKDNSVAPL